MASAGGIRNTRPTTSRAVFSSLPALSSRRPKDEQKILKCSSRKKPCRKNRVDLEVEQAVVDFTFEQPAFGQLRVSNELRKRGVFISPELALPGTVKNPRFHLYTIVVYERCFRLSREAFVALLAHEIAHSVVEKNNHHENEAAVDKTIISWGFEKELAKFHKEREKYNL